MIITGGPSGIGYHAGLALAAEGVNLIVADINLDGATKVAAELTQKGVQAFPFKVDVSKAADVETMVDFAVEKLGTLNGIFNNAGIGLVKPTMNARSKLKLKVLAFGAALGADSLARKLAALAARAEQSRATVDRVDPVPT